MTLTPVPASVAARNCVGKNYSLKTVWHRIQNKRNAEKHKVLARVLARVLAKVLLPPFFPRKLPLPSLLPALAPAPLIASCPASAFLDFARFGFCTRQAVRTATLAVQKPDV